MGGSGQGGVGTFNGVKCLGLRAKRLIERGREREVEEWRGESGEGRGRPDG